MSSKPSFLVAACALTFASLPVAAQQSADVATLREAEDEDMIVQPFGLTVDDIDDMDLESPTGEKIGKIEEVLIDASGEPVAVVVEIDEFGGIDDRDLVLGLDQLQLMDRHFVTSADDATLESLPDGDD